VGLYRTPARALRLARLPVDLRQADVLSPPSLAAAFAGCGVVFHCAYRPGGSPDEQFQTNVEGTVNVLRAAREAGVRRVVYTSTMAVYGYPPSGAVTETWPHRDPGGGAYAASKIAAEARAVSLAAELGLELVVLQPTIVYGPECPAWTVGPIREMLERRLALIDEGGGNANCVYVDDLVSALLLAAVHPAAAGRTYLVNHPDVPTFADFLGAYAQMVGCRALPSLSPEEAARRAPRRPSRRAAIGVALRAVRTDAACREALLSHPEIRWAARVGRGLAAALLPGLFGNGAARPQAADGSTETPDLSGGPAYPPPPVVSPTWVRLTASRATYAPDRLRGELGWAPQVDWKEGMRLTAGWLAVSGLVPRVHGWGAPARAAAEGVAV
ncbi:MAG TPA: NAD-dependent epimerase/dehydratase family protein, partial [Candidatus Methylomirabilis sp.]